MVVLEQQVLVLRAQVVRQVLQVFLGLTVVEALLDQLVRLEQLDYKALTEQTDHLVLQVLQVLQDQMVPQV
jgi:hypothetical protein